MFTLHLDDKKHSAFNSQRPAALKHVETGEEIRTRVSNKAVGEKAQLISAIINAVFGINTGRLLNKKQPTLSVEVLMDEATRLAEQDGIYPVSDSWIFHRGSLFTRNGDWHVRRRSISTEFTSEVKIRSYVDDFNGTVNVQVIDILDKLVASAVRKLPLDKLNKVSNFNDVIDDCLYELLICGWVTPDEITTFRTTPIGRSFPFIVEGVRYRHDALDLVFADFQNGVLPILTSIGELYGSGPADGFPVTAINLNVVKSITLTNGVAVFTEGRVPKGDLAAVCPDVLSYIEFLISVAKDRELVGQFDYVAVDDFGLLPRPATGRTQHTVGDVSFTLVTPPGNGLVYTTNIKFPHKEGRYVPDFGTAYALVRSLSENYVVE